MKECINLETGASREFSLSELDGASGGMKMDYVNIGPVTVMWWSDGAWSVGNPNIGCVLFGDGPKPKVCGARGGCVPIK